MWPLPCKPEALAAASTGFVRGGAGVLLDSCINKYVNRFPSCGVRITGAMFNGAQPGQGAGDHFSIMWLPGTWGVVPQSGGTWSVCYWRGCQPACQTTATLSL